MKIESNLNEIFSSNLGKIAQPVQLTQPVMETPNKGVAEGEGFLSKPVKISTPGDALPDQKKVLSDSFDTLQTRIYRLRWVLDIINAGRPDGNSQEAMRIVDDCINISSSIKKDLKNMAVI